MPDVDYYELLGVRADATPEQLRSAYRALARSLHPDAGGTAGTFRLLREAYETLADPDRRAEYDRVGTGVAAAPVPATARAAAAPPPAPPQPRPSWRRRPLGDDPDFVPGSPRVDTATIPWWENVDAGSRVRCTDAGSPGHAPASLALAAVVALAIPLVLPLDISGPPLAGLLLALTAAIAAAVVVGRRYLGTLRTVRDFRAEFGDRRVFGTPGREPDQLGERLTADVLSHYLTRLPGARIFHGLAWPDSVFADVDHAVLCGSRLVLLESKRWLPGRYGVDRHGVLLRDGRRFRGGGSRLADSVEEFRALLPGVEVRGALVLYPSRAGELTTSPGGETVAPPMTPEMLVREVGAWLAAEPSTVDRDVFRTVLGQVVGTG